MYTSEQVSKLGNILGANLKFPDRSWQGTLRVHHACPPPGQVAANHIRKSRMQHTTRLSTAWLVRFSVLKLHVHQRTSFKARQHFGSQPEVSRSLTTEHTPSTSCVPAARSGCCQPHTKIAYVNS